MAKRRPKRVKTIANRPHRTTEVGVPSSAPLGRSTKKMDPFFSPELQATRLSRFQGRKLAYVQYADISWLVEQGFKFPLETQGANPSIELHGWCNTLDLSFLRCGNSPEEWNTLPDSRLSERVSPG
ncbi:hypothetical protein Lal_00013464 [Lupinus albus]|nr:hypothetical protein Lal_00013464 [Lupinus albus]